MSYTITREDFDSLVSCWDELSQRLKWNSVFVLPAWLKVWWQVFGTEAEMYLRAVRQKETVIGIAPLMVREGKASIIGSADVCDYLDFAVAPGMEEDFFSVLLDDLKQEGINHLELESLRPDSTVLTSLVSVAQGRGYEVLYSTVDVSVEMELPADWEGYLAVLTSKQRHEVRRKLRRFLEAGEMDYHTVEDRMAVNSAMDIFLEMFTGSRSDKAAFLTCKMEAFFRLMADTMAGAGLLRIGILGLDSTPTAAVMYFDYNERIYLYNSGYDPKYNSLSAGLLSKVLCIKESIEAGKKGFDFLRGDEAYKYHLGGREVPLHNCQVTIR